MNTDSMQYYIIRLFAIWLLLQMHLIYRTYVKCLDLTLRLLFTKHAVESQDIFYFSEVTKYGFFLKLHYYFTLFLLTSDTFSILTVYNVK
jgi:hypothetical protein